MPYVRNQREAAERTSNSTWMARERARENAKRPGLGPALGSLNVCWCGRPARHDWPGKVLRHGMSVGAPHPSKIQERSR